MSVTESLAAQLSDSLDVDALAELSSKALEEGERAAEEHEAELRRQFELAKRRSSGTGAEN